MDVKRYLTMHSCLCMVCISQGVWFHLQVHLNKLECHGKVNLFQ